MSHIDIEKYLAIAFFFTITLCFFLAWFFWQRARHRELMLMIEKGLDPAGHMTRTGQMLRKAAFILLGAGVGAALITVLSALGFRQINSDSGTLASFAICISLALLFSARSGPKTD
jgi:hypothetical protein